MLVQNISLLLIVVCLINGGETTLHNLVSDDGTEIAATPHEESFDAERSPIPSTAIMPQEGNSVQSTSNKNNKNQVVWDVDFGEDAEKDFSARSEADDIYNSTENSFTAEEELPRPLFDIPSVHYSKPTLKNLYKSKDDFHPKGMEHLYFITNLFLQLVHRQKEMPDKITPLVAQEIASPTLDKAQAMRVVKIFEENWGDFLLHYIGLASLVVIGLLIAAIMPLFGLIFLCCRCAGRCGAEEPHYDKKRDPCKRVTLGTLLATSIVFLLLGLVCCFVSNARMEEGVQKFPTDIRVAINDTKVYIENTDIQVNTLFIKNYNELQEVLFNKLDSSGELVKSELARVTKAIAVDNLTTIAISLKHIREDLDLLKNTTHQIQKETTILQNGLQDVANRLRKLRAECGVSECKKIGEFADELAISGDFKQYLEFEIMPKLPDVEQKLEEVSGFLLNKIEIKVKRGKLAFDHIATDIQNKVQRSIPEIKDKIKNGGKQLEEATKSVHKLLYSIDPLDANEYVQVMQSNIDEYAKYRFWSFLALCFLLLFITLFFVFGIFFGCCGRLPDESSSCHKSTGAVWLMCGVGTTFLFSSVIMVATTILFVAGSASEIFICDPFRDPSHSDVFNLIAQQVKLEKIYSKGEVPKLNEMISKCHNNESIYSVLSLHMMDNRVNEVKNYREKLNLNKQIEDLENKIKVDTKIEILSDDARTQLKHLAGSSIAKPELWNLYTDILEQEVLKINLIELAGLLNQTADMLPAGMNVSAQLTNDAIYLEGLQRWLVSIHKNTLILKNTTARLNITLKFNQTSLDVAINELIAQAEFAQSYLQTNGSAEILALVNRFTTAFFDDVDDYVEHLNVAINKEIGHCAPMSTVYNATTSALCKDILYPFNGFWASVGWCFFFFIPCMILAVHLASLYRKTEPYPGPLTESHESMYDAYAERDNIPLTTGYDKKLRSRPRDYEPGAHIGAAYSADPHNITAPHTSPPHNFENADGGPPRYTSQPSLSPEYERPPPYYYPGPGQQYYGGPPSGQGPGAGGLQVHPPPPGPPSGAPMPGSGAWNTPQRTINIGGWKISPAYSRDEYDA